VKAWQSRPLDGVYPIIYLDALVVKVRESSHIQNKAIHLIVGINTSGRKEVLGLWVTHNEGAKFWLQVLTDPKNRGWFPNEDAVNKLVYLALRNISGKWSLPIRDWASAMNRFAILFEGRMPLD
jgi:transposase-like protein